MDRSPGRGTLSEIPFARLLADVWQREFSGILRVGTGGGKSFAFEGGALLVGRETLPEKEFLESLLTSGEADLLSLGRCEDYAAEHDVSTVRAMLEIKLFDSTRLWALLEGFAKTEAWRLFDVEEAEFELEPRPAPIGRVYVRNIFPPGLVLEGARRMRNERVIDAHVPGANQTVQALAPFYLDLLDLTGPERYVLDLLATARTAGDLCATSELTERESRRILFMFCCLGVAGTPPGKVKTTRLPAELSLGDMDKLFGLFNAKCAYIHKYISKEIGPVALSVIGKSLEDIRGRLDPAFQGLELKDDGRIELRTFLKVNMNIGGEENRRALLRSMDEILVAEVLAVKRTLGSAHESALVKGLERIGEPA